jgi:hypothetical protein
LAVQCHQHLNGLQLPVLCGNRTAFMHKFIREVFDGMAENLQRMTRLRRDAAQ